MLALLANLNDSPESLPIDMLIKIPGTSLENVADVDPFDFVRTIAIARIIMPKSTSAYRLGERKCWMNCKHYVSSLVPIRFFTVKSYLYQFPLHRERINDNTTLPLSFGIILMSKRFYTFEVTIYFLTPQVTLYLCVCFEFKS